MASKAVTITNNTANAALVPVADIVPGSRPLSNGRREKYCRLRAMMVPRVAAYKSSGWKVATDVVAGVNAARLENNREIGDRIAYLSRQDEELLRGKRQRLEESLWNILEADPATMFDAEGVKDLKSMPAEVRHAIENITVDEKGRLAAAKFYNKLQANQELRKMLGLDKPVPQQSEFDRMSDADLINELAKQANELGVQIDLSYKFGEGD
jgi:Terminase small subunit